MYGMYVISRNLYYNIIRGFENHSPIIAILSAVEKNVFSLVTLRTRIYFIYVTYIYVYVYIFVLNIYIFLKECKELRFSLYTKYFITSEEHY